MEYPKIETLYDRDPKTFKVIEGNWRLPVFEYLKDNTWVFTEKVDGTNVRVLWNIGVVRFGGKTDNAQMPTFLLAKLRELFKVEKLAQVFPDLDTPVTIYGEGYGAKIQKGGGNYNPSGVDIVLFDILVGRWWLERVDVEDVASKLGIRCVPIVGKGTLQGATNMVKEGFTSQWGNFPAEGLVLRPVVSLFTRVGHRVITKIKTKDFPKKEEEDG